MALGRGWKDIMLTIKYRPHTLDEVVGQEQAVELIRSQSIRNKWFPVQLLYGQYGGGKTTMARIIALCANCEHKDENGNPCLECDTCKAILDGTHPDVVEIAAAVNNGVDDVRELIQNAAFKPVSLKYKVYIIDEVHMLSKGAFNALLKLLENPPEHCIFILCTTEKDMILDTIQSRTAPYSFTSLSMEKLKEHVLYVSAKEGFKVSDDAAAVIAKRANGSMRTALMLLEMATKETGEATGASVEKMLGVSKPAEVFGVIKAMVLQDKAELVRKMVSLNESGASVQELVTDLSEGLTDLALASVYPEGLFGSDTYVSMVKDILVHGTTELFEALAGEMVSLKGSINREMRGQDLTVKLLGIMISNKVSDSNNNLLRTVELLKAEVERLKNGGIAAGRPIEVKNEAVPEEQKPEDDFSDIDTEKIRERLKAGIENGKLVDEEMLNETPFVQKAMADVAKIFEPAEVPEGFESADKTDEVPFVEEEKAEKQEQKAEETSFDLPDDDLFSFLMGGMELPDFPIESQVQEPEEKKEVAEPVRDLTAEYQILAALTDEDEAFKAAMMGCEVKSEDGCVVIRTPFPQTMYFVDAYLRAYQFRYPETNLDYIKVRTTDELIG